MSRLTRMRVASTLATSLAILLAASPGQAGLGSGTFRLTAKLYGRCVSVEYPPAGGALTVLQKRNGAVIATAKVAATNGAKACLKPLKPNDRIVLKQGGSTIRTSVIPRLTLTLDLAGDVIAGSVPASAPNYIINAQNQLAGIFAGSVEYGGTGTVSGGRATFSDDVTGSNLEDLGAGDPVRLTWFDTNEDVFQLTTAAPYALTTESSAKVRGTAARGSTVTITLRRGGAVASSFSRTLPGESVDYAGVFRAAGTQVRVEPGDRIFHSQRSAAKLTVLQDTPFGDPQSNGSVSMTCFPNGPWVLFHNGTFRAGGIAGPDGAVSVTDISNGGGDLTSADVLDLGCETKAGFGGERWTIRFVD